MIETMTLKEQRDLQDKQRIMIALTENKGHRRAASIDLCMSERTLYRYIAKHDLKDFARNL